MAQASPPAKVPVLMVENLGVSFAGVQAVAGVSLSVAQGELRVLLGANGAGKTTLMDLISGKTRSMTGRVLLCGRDITGLDEPEVARAGVGRKFQIPSVFRALSVRGNLEVAGIRRRGVWSNLGFGLAAAVRRRCEETLALTGLGEMAGTLAGHLSHGQTQWLELGMLMMQDPTLLLLDEPTAGMTADETMRTAQIIRSLRGSHTTVVVEHDMAFVREIAEQVTVLHLGRVLAEGDMSAIQADPRVREAYLGASC